MSIPGAVRNTGTDMKSRVVLTVAVSTQVPCLRAVKKPRGIPRPTAMIMAAIFNWAETQMRLLRSSDTSRPLYWKLSPKSPCRASLT